MASATVQRDSDPQTMQPKVAIELDDSSYQAAERRLRDAEVDLVYETAGLSLLHLSVQRGYNTSELAVQLAPFIKNGTPKPAAQSKVAPANGGASTDAAPSCPKCGTPMVIRVANRGSRRGSTILRMSELSELSECDPHQISDRSQQKAGHSLRTAWPFLNYALLPYPEWSSGHAWPVTWTVWRWREFLPDDAGELIMSHAVLMPNCRTGPRCVLPPISLVLYYELIDFFHPIESPGHV